ncbi:MAG: hypothetical protein ACTSU5_04270 [Promethearchaeota archaeon]
MNLNSKLIDRLYDEMDPETRERVDRTIQAVVETKLEHGKICVVTGSGPNIHEGVTTLVAELIGKGVVDGVLTSSAVIAHEMAGALDQVKRIDGALVDFGDRGDVPLPKDGKFELTLLDDATLEEVGREVDVDLELVRQLRDLDGDVIVKAAGNMAYPMGLRTEALAEEILELCTGRFSGQYSLELVAGLGADPLTMIGAGAANDVPVLVSIPQMVGGGAVGLCVGDSVSTHARCRRIARVLGESSLIIESGLALAQEVHDGPFETYTGHGIWASWQGQPVFSLKGKTLVRFDLDPNLDRVWKQQRDASLVQRAIAEGKPKTKLTGVPFRMEMSGFARLETSIPVIGDIGALWPVVAARACADLGVKLDFVSYPQETPDGQKAREWIVNNVRHVDRAKVLEEVDKLG